MAAARAAETSDEDLIFFLLFMEHYFSQLHYVISLVPPCANFESSKV